MFRWSQEETKVADPSDQEFQRQLDKMVEKSDQFTQITSETAQATEK